MKWSIWRNLDCASRQVGNVKWDESQFSSEHMHLTSSHVLIHLTFSYLLHLRISTACISFFFNLTRVTSNLSEEAMRAVEMTNECWKRRKFYDKFKCFCNYFISFLHSFPSTEYEKQYTWIRAMAIYPRLCITVVLRTCLDVTFCQKRATFELVQSNKNIKDLNCIIW